MTPYDQVATFVLEGRMRSLEGRLLEAKVAREHAEHRCHALEGDLQDLRREVARRDVVETNSGGLVRGTGT